MAFTRTNLYLLTLIALSALVRLSGSDIRGLGTSLNGRYLDSNSYFHDEQDLSIQSSGTQMQKATPLSGYPVPHSDHIPQHTYNYMLKHTAITCVDVLLYLVQVKRYILIVRDNPPMKGFLGFVGGRMWKGETFFETAARKVRDECGLGESIVVKVMHKDHEETLDLGASTTDVLSSAPSSISLHLHDVIGVYNTMFENSAVPGVPTQTVNTVLYGELFFPVDDTSVGTSDGAILSDVHDVRNASAILSHASPDPTSGRIIEISIAAIHKQLHMDSLHSGYELLTEEQFLAHSNVSWVVKKGLLDYLMQHTHAMDARMKLGEERLRVEIEKIGGNNMTTNGNVGLLKETLAQYFLRRVSDRPHLSMMFAVEPFLHCWRRRLEVASATMDDLEDMFVGHSFYHGEDGEPLWRNEFEARLEINVAANSSASSALLSSVPARDTRFVLPFPVYQNIVQSSTITAVDVLVRVRSDSVYDDDYTYHFLLIRRPYQPFLNKPRLPGARMLAFESYAQTANRAVRNALGKALEKMSHESRNGKQRAQWRQTSLSGSFLRFRGVLRPTMTYFARSSMASPDGHATHPSLNSAATMNVIVYGDLHPSALPTDQSDLPDNVLLASLDEFEGMVADSPYFRDNLKFYLQETKQKNFAESQKLREEL